MNDPAWPSEDEWGPWNLINHKDSFETRKHEELQLWERRCRHCKEALDGLPPRSCQNEGCQALNVIGGYEPTSFRQLGAITDYIFDDIDGSTHYFNKKGWIATFRPNDPIGQRWRQVLDPQYQ